tara:strand:+ start:1138 stop:1878 length:741 start_codon:yes stop_codon:yes gene_type:complete
MKFNVDSKIMEKALEDIQGKGKYGISNGSLDDCVYLILVNNTLELWNADSALSLTISIPVEGSESGEFILDAKTLTSFLKKFNGEATFLGEDVLTVSCENQKVVLPRIVSHSNMNAITRIRGMLKHIEYEEEPQTLFMFGSSKFESCFTLDSNVFKNTMGLCELIKSGVYRLDCGDEIIISSRTSNSNKYEEVMSVSNKIGEEATVEWSGPLHKFFKGKINFYAKDDFPLLLIGEDRKLIRAPHVS